MDKQSKELPPKKPPAPSVKVRKASNAGKKVKKAS